MVNLPDDCLPHIIKFIGKGSFVYLAGVNRTWRKQYDQVYDYRRYGIEVCFIFPRVDDRATFTTYIATSVSHAEFFLENSTTRDNNRLCYQAARYGALNILQWALARGWFFFNEHGLDEDLLEIAIKNDHLPVAKWLFANGGGLHERLIRRAVDRNHMHILIWLYQNDEQTSEYIASKGHLRALQLAHQYSYPWDEDTCSTAADYGHCEILQWAHQHECPWDERTCAYAAARGDLEMLQWARQHGCPWDEDTCYNAADNRHLEVLRWARANGCPCDSEAMLEMGGEDLLCHVKERLAFYIYHLRPPGSIDLFRQEVRQRREDDTNLANPALHVGGSFIQVLMPGLSRHLFGD